MMFDLKNIECHDSSEHRVAEIINSKESDLRGDLNFSACYAGCL